MRIHESEHQPSWNADLISRQSRLTAALATLVYSLALVVAPLIAWHRGHLAGWILFLIGLLALMILPLVVGSMTATWRRTNWRLAIQSDGLLINLRSYQNHRLPNSNTVLHLNYSEIACASRHVTRMSAPSGDGTINWSEKSLKLTISGVDLDPLRSAIAAERQCRYVRPYFGGTLTVSGRSNHAPVNIIDGHVVCVIWRSRYDMIRPSLKRVLSELETRIAQVQGTTVEQTADWQDMDEDDVDDLILRLVESGDRLSAISLLVQRRDYSLTEAKAFIDGLTERLGA